MKHLRAGTLLGGIALLISCGKSRAITRETTDGSAANAATAKRQPVNQPLASATATPDEAKIELPQGIPRTFKDDGVCPFEGCIYRNWKAEATIPIYEQPDVNSPVAFSLQPGDWVSATTGFVLTTDPGIFEILEELDTGEHDFPAGTKIYVYTAEGEAYYKAWFDGNFFEFEDPGTDKAKLVKEPKNTWWVQIRNSANQEGWTFDGLHFSNNDQLGGPPNP